MEELLLILLLIFVAFGFAQINEDTRTLRCSQAARDTIQVVAVRDSVLRECYLSQIDSTEVE